MDPVRSEMTVQSWNAEKFKLSRIVCAIEALLLLLLLLLLLFTRDCPKDLFVSTGLFLDMSSELLTPS